VEGKIIGEGMKYRPSPLEKDKRMRPLLIREKMMMWKIKYLLTVCSTVPSSRKHSGETG